MYQNITIDHECEGGIEKAGPRITDWHHEACRVMTNGDREVRLKSTEIPIWCASIACTGTYMNGPKIKFILTFYMIIEVLAV